MKLFLVTRPDYAGWDEFIGFIVAARNEDKARHTHPDINYKWDGDAWVNATDSSAPDRADNWVPPHLVEVTHIGSAKKGFAGVILSAFRNG